MSIIEPMIYMIVEHFRDGDARPVYRRFRDKGRLAPDGAQVHCKLGHDGHRALLSGHGMRGSRSSSSSGWRSGATLCDFECIPVVTSAEAARDDGAATVTVTCPA